MKEDFKKQSKKIFEEASKIVSDGAKKVGKNTKELAKLAKLKYDIFTLEQKIKECKVNIGDIIYQSNIDAKDIKVKRLIKEIKKSEINISEKKRKIREEE